MDNLLKAPRDLIPRYSLRHLLGESTRATVYLAYSAALDQEVALKVSRNIDCEAARFSREFQVLAGLFHPGIVELYDYGMHAGREFIAMEYFPCGDLRSRLLKPLQQHEALRCLQGIASALSLVHSQKVLHRDLKPANIMLREDGNTVLIDFGISKHLGHGTRSTAAGVLHGSPFYMSPEQAQGIDLDTRSDLYTLGVIFHEMLTGKKPYSGTAAIEVLQQHVSSPLPQLPPSLARYQPLLDSMMAKSRDDRIDSADKVLVSLAPFVAQLDVGASLQASDISAYR